MHGEGRIGQVSCDLGDTGGIRVGGDPGDLDPPCGDVDEEEDVIADEPKQSQDLDGERVSSRDRAPVSGEEGLPGHGQASFWGGDDTQAVEDTLDGVPTDRDTQIRQGPLDPGVAPGRVLVGHGGDEAGDIRLGPWPAGASLGGPVVLLGDEGSVPAEESLWCHDPGDLIESAASHGLGLGGQPATLSVGEPNPSATTMMTVSPPRTLEE